MRKVRIQASMQQIKAAGLTPVLEEDGRSFPPFHYGPCACSSCQNGKRRMPNKVWRSKEAIPEDEAYEIVCPAVGWSGTRNRIVERYLHKEKKNDTTN